MGRLWMEICSFWWVNPSPSQAYRSKTFQMFPMRTEFFTIWSSCVTYEEASNMKVPTVSWWNKDSFVGLSFASKLVTRWQYLALNAFYELIKIAINGSFVHILHFHLICISEVCELIFTCVCVCYVVWFKSVCVWID